jgi:hypothetical protein
MKTFVVIKNCRYIENACNKAGILFDKSLYENGHDSVFFTGTFAKIPVSVIYNTNNGNFSGTTISGIKFNQNSNLPDKWFNAVLSFCYKSSSEKKAA